MKTSIIHFNRKKGWSASLFLVGLVFVALVFTGCPQAVVDKPEQEKVPPVASKLNARYDAVQKIISANWEATNATEYQVSIEGGSKKETKTVTEKTASFTGIEDDDTTYTITVVAIDNDGIQSKPITATVTAEKATKPAVANLLVEYDAKEKTISAKWDANSVATTFQVSIEGGSSTSEPKIVTEKTVKFTGIEADGTAYTIMVKPMADDGTPGDEAGSSITASSTPQASTLLPAVFSLTASYDATGKIISASWEHNDATKYQVSINGGSMDETKTVTEKTASFSGIGADDTTYTLTVEAIAADGTKGSMSIIKVTAAKPTLPTISNLKASYDPTKKTVSMRWDSNGAAATFEVVITGGSKNETKTVSTTNASFTGIEASGTTHTITVEGITDSGTRGGKTSTTVTADSNAVATLPTVSNLLANYNATPKTISVSWSAANATEYQVSIKGGSMDETKTVTEKTASFTGIEAGNTTYIITVVAISADGVPSAPTQISVQAAKPTVSKILAKYNATPKTISVSWSAANATKYQVSITGGSKNETQTVTEKTASFTGIQADDTTYTITVVAIAADDTRSDPVSTPVKASKNRELTVTRMEISGGSLLAAGRGSSISVYLENVDLAGSLTLQLYQGDQPVEGTSTTLNLWSGDGSDGGSSYMDFPSAAGTYTVRLLNDGSLVAGAFATVTLVDPEITSITLNRDTVQPGYTVTATLEGNEVLGSASLSYSITPSESGWPSPFTGTTFTFTAPSTDGTYTLTVSQRANDGSATKTLGTVEFTVKADVPLPSMDNPFADGLSYAVSESDGIRSWTVQGNYLVEKYPLRWKGDKIYNWENWYTFNHDTANKRIELTPYKLFNDTSEASLTRAEYEDALRASPDFSLEYGKTYILEMLADPEEKKSLIEYIKEMDPAITGLESMSDEELFNTYISVMLKGMGYTTWDDYVAAMIQQELKTFDCKTTYSYVADSSTGSLKVTEWWDSNTTFKTLYDAGKDVSFNSSYSSGSNRLYLRMNEGISINLTDDTYAYYRIQSVTDTTIVAKRSSGDANETDCPKEATFTFGAITDKEPAYEGVSPQKQMDVTYNGQNYTLTYSLAKYNFSIQ